MDNLPDRLQEALSASYRLDRELGRGGMATVYLAQDLKHDRPVALKLLNPTVAELIGTERFTREIRLAARLQHPHICSVYDSGESSGQLWFTMPYIQGESLDARLARDGPLAVDDALRIAREAAQALAYAHEQGVLHRDIKPANLLLARDGSTLVADFGIARALGDSRPSNEQTITQTGFSPGTPAYMSPEQAAGLRDLDGRSDVFSLGLVLYEMLVGERPFPGGSLVALAQLGADSLPRVRSKRPEVTAAVDDVLHRAVAFKSEERFGSMAEFGAALDALRRGDSALKDSLATSRRSAAAGQLGQSRWTAGWRRRALIVGGVAALVAATLVLRHGVAAVPAAPLASAAVLPFADISPARDQEYFSDGLTEELTNALSKLPGLHVAARSSAFQFRGTGIDVREVGRKLSVGTVLEGSVRRSGNRLRVNAQLVNTANGYELWSETYDRNLADVFQVQEEIARAIVSALRVQLAGGRDSTLVDRPTEDLDAYDLYLKGQFAMNERSETTIPEAVHYFEQAVARDSGFARAWAGLADAYVLLPLYTGTSPATTWPRAKPAALRAIKLGGGVAEAHSALAYGTMLYDWNWAEAEREFQQAIAADPRYPTAHHWYADFLAGRNRLDESLTEMRRAQELDPLSRIISAETGWVYNSLHRSAEADSEITKVLRLDPNFSQALFVLGLIRIEQGRSREAIMAFRHALDSGGFNAHTAGALVWAYAAAGKRDSATALLDTLSARSAHEYIPPFAFAVAYTGLGDRDKAFHWLDRGVKERDVVLPETFFELLLDPLKQDSRYAAIATRMSGGR